MCSSIAPSSINDFLWEGSEEAPTSFPAPLGSEDSCMEVSCRTEFIEVHSPLWTCINVQRC